MDALVQLLPILLIAVVFWLLLIRPQRRRQHAMTQLQDSITPGSEVMIGAGIFGTVTSVDGETLLLEVAPGMTIKVIRGAVVRVSGAEPAVVDEPPAPDVTED